MEKERIGIFGGTFDPPHLGHLILAAEARHQLRLNRLLWLLTASPPHKSGQKITDLQHRLSMLKLAIGDNPFFELSRVEIDRPGPHYALETMRLLTEQYPAADLIYLIGGDSLHNLPGWHRPTAFIAQCKEIGVMRRPGDRVELDTVEQKIPGITQKITFVNAPLLEISSRDIRKKVADEQHFRYYLPKPVYEYIIKSKLYYRQGGE